MALRKDRERAERARALLDDPLLVEVFDTLEREFFEGWSNSRSLDEREEIYNMIRVVRAVRDRLDKVVQDGMIAARQLDPMNGVSGNA